MQRYCDICDEASYWIGYENGVKCSYDFHIMFKTAMHDATELIKDPKKCSICKKAIKLGICKETAECCPRNHWTYLPKIYAIEPNCVIKMPYEVGGYPCEPDIEPVEKPWKCIIL